VNALRGDLAETPLQLCALRRARGVAQHRLVDGGGGAEDAGSALRIDCIVGAVRVTRHPYEVPGWGVGEVWVRDGVLVQHELPSEALRAEGGRTGRAIPELSLLALDSGPGPGEAALSGSPDGGARRPAGTLPPCPSLSGAGFVPDLCRRFAEHLRGVRTSYDELDLDLNWATPLQRQLVAAARAVPWGEVVSYAELAALAGRPGAARAAGSFCADNRYSLIIPCHRVVAANGIGGYGSAGPALKRRLLALEGVEL
jgi:O-6-methylguanine DNA methyltransferase